MEALKAMFGQGWLGSLVGIVGLIVAIILYRASRIGPRPVYQLRALRLIEKEKRILPEQVEILFGGRSIPRLTMTHVILWNSGKATLDGKNIVTDDPLRLEFSKESEVLRVRVPKVTREVNKFIPKINPHARNQVICSFDYLDAGDGGIIEVLHTDEERYPRILGTIRGVPKGPLDWGRIIPSERKFPEAVGEMFGKPAQIFLSYTILMAGILTIILGFIFPIIYETSEATGGERLILFIAGPVYFFLGLALLLINRRRFPKSLMVEDIE